MASRRWWRLAWLCVALAVPLRLAFFAGFGLGDDPNESLSLAYFAEHLRLNPDDFLHYRVLNVVVRGLSYRWFGVTEAAFILPILAAALGTHAMGTLLAGELLGARGAFLASVLFLATPYETLASTANVPDYFHACSGTGAAWAVARGIRRDRAGLMALAAVLLALGFLNRVSTILLVPVFALATLATPTHRRRWLVFWAAFVALIVIGCLADRAWSGSPLGWFSRNSGGGLEVSGILGRVLAVYPRYVFLRDDLGHWMFGLTGWAAAAGALVAAMRAVRGRAGAAELGVLLAFFVFGGLVELLPHRLRLDGYWSHPRIFRYLAQLAPALYLCAAYALDRAWVRQPALGVAGVAAVVAIGLWNVPAVTEPLRDANRDARALVAFLKTHERLPGEARLKIHTDYWRVDQIRARYPGFAAAWELVGVGPDSPSQRVAFLGRVTDGVVVSGGASLPWYSGPGLVVSLSALHYQPPHTWRLAWTYPGPVTPWRLEPLRVWMMRPAAR
jgi:hypothetical protein